MDIHEVVFRIGYFRNKKHLSARELSLMIGKHEGYINKLESQDFNLTTEVLLQIIDALEITPEEFFSENYVDFNKNKEIFALIKNLPSDKKDGLIEFLK